MDRQFHGVVKKALESFGKKILIIDIVDKQADLKDFEKIGEFEYESGMSGFRWKKFVRDTKPFPGIEIRQINYQLLWNEGKHVYTYDAYIYVKPK